MKSGTNLIVGEEMFSAVGEGVNWMALFATILLTFNGSAGGVVVFSGGGAEQNACVINGSFGALG